MAPRKAVKKNVKEKEKLTTSKKIIFVSYLIGFILTGIVVFGDFKGYNVSTIGMIAIASYAEITASNAFYFWKAKKENTMKIALATVKETSTEKVDDVVKLVNAMGGIV